MAVLNQGELKIYDEPKKVFAQRDIIKNAGLLEPEVMQLLQVIKDKGLDVDINALNEKEALKNICKALKGRGVKIQC